MSLVGPCCGDAMRCVVLSESLNVVWAVVVVYARIRETIGHMGRNVRSARVAEYSGDLTCSRGSGYRRFGVP